MKIEIEIPTKCPSCASTLELVNAQLFCRNSACEAQSTKKVEAFAKKMKIKGLGPATISKLEFYHPIEIYETPLESYIEILGDKVGTKLFSEIQNSKNTDFATFLSALNIPLVGSTLSKKIASQVVDLEGFCENADLLNIGTKAKENIYIWLESEFDDYYRLQKHLNLKREMHKEVPKKGSVCITGKLKEFTNRNEAKKFLEEHGYTVTSTVTGKTDFLICEEKSNSSKVKKAESLGIPILTINDIINR